MKLDLQGLRYYLNLTQKDVCQRGNISQPTLSSVEKAGSAPTLLTIEKYIKAMGCKLKVSVITPLGDEIELETAPFYTLQELRPGVYKFTRRRSKDASITYSIALDDNGGLVAVAEGQDLGMYSSLERFLNDQRIRLDKQQVIYLEKCLHTAKFAV
jgi:transcriptional regulator with XRE-family HTH domain